jgi:hypothetical protein
MYKSYTVAPYILKVFMAALHNNSCELKSTSMMKREWRFNPINPVSAEILSIQSAFAG